MRRRRLLAAATLALAHAAAAAPMPESGFGLPRDASVDGERVDSLIHFTIAATTVLFVVVGAVLLVALVRHRRDHPAVHSHGSKVSIAVVLGFVGLVALAVDGYLFVHTVRDMRQLLLELRRRGGPGGHGAHRGERAPVGLGRALRRARREVQHAGRRGHAERHPRPGGRAGAHPARLGGRDPQLLPAATSA